MKKRVKKKANVPVLPFFAMSHYHADTARFFYSVNYQKLQPHAELLAIRAASQVLGSANLEGCSVYANGHPCPMCMATMRLAGIKSVSYAYSNEDGTPFGLSTAEIYIELAKPFAEQSMKIQYIPIRVENRTDLYAHWKNYQANHSGSK